MKPKKRLHKVLVEIVASTPITEKHAINAMTRALEERGVFRRTFMFRPFYTPRYHIRSQLKSFTYAAGKYQEEGKLYD